MGDTTTHRVKGSPFMFRAPSTWEPSGDDPPAEGSCSVSSPDGCATMNVLVCRVASSAAHSTASEALEAFVADFSPGPEAVVEPPLAVPHPTGCEAAMMRSRVEDGAVVRLALVLRRHARPPIAAFLEGATDRGYRQRYRPDFERMFASATFGTLDPAFEKRLESLRPALEAPLTPLLVDGSNLDARARRALYGKPIGAGVMCVLAQSGGQIMTRVDLRERGLDFEAALPEALLYLESILAEVPLSATRGASGGRMISLEVPGAAAGLLVASFRDRLAEALGATEFYAAFPRQDMLLAFTGHERDGVEEQLATGERSELPDVVWFVGPDGLRPVTTPVPAGH